MKDYKCTRKKEVKVGARVRNICTRADLFGFEGEIFLIDDEGVIYVRYDNDPFIGPERLGYPYRTVNSFLTYNKLI